MSEVLERYTGFATVARLAAPGMVAVKGDLADPRLAAALGAVPGVRRAEGGVLWMAPDEVLVVCADGAAEAARLAAALAGGHVTVADVSDLRAVFAVSGAGARDVLAKLCPVDFADFPVGGVRRTRAAQVAALVWRTGDQDWRVMTLRSVADYAWGLLTMAARPGGEVGLYR